MASSGCKGNRLVDIFGRQSFDRFGDDLSENILSYLSIEDKYRLRCVSKQWSQLIPNTQTLLNFCGLYDNFGPLSRQRISGQTSIDSTRLATVLKTFTAIKTIRFSVKFIYDDEVLDAISQWCPRLESIRFRFDRFSVDAITRFGQSVGQSLRVVGISDGCQPSVEKTQILLDLCPNIESLHYIGSHTTFNDLRPIMTLKELFVTPPRNMVSIRTSCAILVTSLPVLAPNLRVFHFNGPNTDINDQTICQLIDGCRQLNSIKLWSVSDITTKTIDKLVKTANNRPKELFAFTAVIRKREMKSSLRLKPKNLLLDIKLI